MDRHPPQFFTRTDHAWEAMLEACKEAETTIDMEQYIFSIDEIGTRFIDIFKKKREQGVHVRLICDTVGSYHFYNSHLPQELRRLGIDIRFFNIVSPWRIHNIFSWYFRDHRKILVVDGKTAFTGGVGVRDDMKLWRDTHVKVTGHIVQEIANVFNEMWTLAAQKNIFTRIRYSRHAPRKINFVTNAPYPRRRFLYDRVIDAIRGAKKHVYISTPYFVPSPKLIRALRLAVKRGVDVRVIVPKTSDSSIASRAAHSFFYELLLYGIRIFEYTETFMHAKTAIVDDKWATVGSFNYDNLSFYYNHEANIVSTDHLYIEALKEHFETDLGHCTEVIAEEWARRPAFWKLREFLILPFRRFI